MCYIDLLAPHKECNYYVLQIDTSKKKITSPTLGVKFWINLVEFKIMLNCNDTGCSFNISDFESDHMFSISAFPCDP